MDGALSNKQKKDLLILFLGSQPKTANEIIEEIHRADFEAQIKRHWKFYVHLNKLPDKLYKSGHFVSSKSKVGETGRLEKIWQLTEMGKARYDKIISRLPRESPSPEMNPDLD